MPAVTNPPNNSQPPYEGRMMMLPTGEVVYSQGSAQLAIIDPGITTPTIPAPVITSAPTQSQPGNSFPLSGTGLTGVSATVGYGDDASQSTSYPLVRLIDASGNVFYARTKNHSTMAIGTGSAGLSPAPHLPETPPNGH